MSLSTANVSLSQIGQIAVPVRDIDRAVAFYRDVLGMRLLFRAPPALAFFDAGGVRLMLDRPEKPEFAHHSSVLYFKVDDINASHDALLARGVKFEDAPHLIAKLPDHDLWMTFFRDSEENMLALMCEVRGAS
jgi:catechol 2,3-dioxygenase-like lactoylglutathione lyase family enzyme